MICERHEVFVVPFPFHEVPVTKRRPVVVLSGSDFNEANGHTLVAMITTAKKTSWPSDSLVRDRESAGLTTACVVRLRLQSLPNDLFVRRIGKLAALDRLSCEKQLAGMLT